MNHAFASLSNLKYFGMTLLDFPEKKSGIWGYFFLIHTVGV